MATVNDKYRQWQQRAEELAREIKSEICKHAYGTSAYDLLPYEFKGNGKFREVTEVDGCVWARRTAGVDLEPVENMSLKDAYALLQQLQEEHVDMLKDSGLKLKR